MHSNRSEQQESAHHTLRPSNSKRRNYSLAKGRSSTGFLKLYDKARPLATLSNRELDKPLMEKNYNEDIIRKKIRESEEKEAHKIVFMKALSAYKKLANGKEGQ